jgi:acyl-homoserine lactone acylase PvdQ
VLGIGMMVSVAFNFVVLLTWRYDFGRSVLQPTAASQWSEPLQELAKADNGNGNGVPDRDVMLALTPKKAEALAQRIDRVRAVLGPNKKKPRYNSVLSITSDAVGEAQGIMQKVLDKLTKRWVSISCQCRQAVGSLLPVRLGKTTT